MKYWSLFVRGFIKSIQYRSEILVWFLLDMLPVLVLIFVWISIYAQKEAIGGYNLAQVLQYYFIAAMINAITASHFESWRVREIRDGKIDFYLTRPLSYLIEIAIRHLAGKALHLLITIPLFIGLWLILSVWLDFGTLTTSWLSLLQFLLLMLITFIIEFLIATIIVLIGFWIEGAEGLEHFKWISITIFSGWMIPVALMPDGLQHVVKQLPFRYMYDVPISILQDKAVLTAFDVLYASSFVAVLAGITWLIWRKAQYQYASSGG